MSAPRTKRQFAGAASDPAQRQITSFFTSSSPTSNHISPISSSPSIIPQRPDSAPNVNLPGTIQSNLLSVGMRIRKSVPEGYKTGNYNSNAFALWDENDADPVTTATIMGEGQRSRANAFSSPRELLPFCGIHKVGGLDTQQQQPEGHPCPVPPIPNMRAGHGSATPVYQPCFGVGDIGMGADDVPGLTSSQESIDSNASPTSASRARKRFFVEDEDDETPAQLNLWRFNGDFSHSLSPVGGNNGRAMAVPRKGRLRAKFSGGAAATTALPPGPGQENVMVIDSDFEEAEFLDQGTWEVNMSDA
ncbi:ribonucleotide reductase inhibitor-domain-containing protein [Xylaria sp. FL1042]|nr:ribonucleotide reductase inhibitor-domain-containing protein [Xylaria sp. FL1042]